MTTPTKLPRRGLIAAVLLIVIVSASVTSWRWWERRQAGDFTRDPHFCGLVDPETIHRLLPTSYGGREDVGSCTWAAPREKGVYRANLHLRASRLTVDLARDNYREQRSGDERGWEKDTQEDLPGLGEEAFLRFQPPTPGKNITAQVVFRRSNMLITIAYARSDDDRQAARAGAIDAARDAVAQLRP
ncbi:hypothetical protein ACWGA0_08025 [Streptomyces erythrochromogenes]